MDIATNEAIRLISLALADKISGAKVSINTNHSVSTDTIIDLLTHVHNGTVCVINANLDIIKGDWHFDTN